MDSLFQISGLSCRGHAPIKRIALVVCPFDGEVHDRVTHRFYKPSAVKYTPLGVLSLGASLREYEVKVIDASSRHLSVDDTIAEIEAFAPDVLGLSVVTYRAWAMREILKRTTARLKVVGGPHATYNSENCLKQGAHACFRGDAELSFPRWLKNGCPPGIFEAIPVNLDELPLPARDLIDLSDYLIPDYDRKNLLFDAGPLRLPMYSSKGCPLRCSYCDVQSKKYDVKGPARIVQEMQDIIRLGASSVHVLDDAFNIKRERIRELCRLLIDAGSPIPFSVRGVVEVREDLMKLLSEAGCVRWHVGLEFLDDRLLERFRKSQRMKDTRLFCDYARKYGIDLVAYFIIGAGESTEYERDLPKMIEGLGIKIPYFNVLTPLSETDYYSELLADGTFKTDFWAAFSADPVKDFEIPSHRTELEEAAIAARLSSYIQHFNDQAS